MDKSILGTRIVTQVGILVNDIEKSCQDFADFLGVENPGYSITDTIDKPKPNTGRTLQSQGKTGLLPRRREPNHRINRTRRESQRLEGGSGQKRRRVPSYCLCY